MNVLKISLITLLLLVYNKVSLGSNLDGTVSLVYKNVPQVFHDGEFAKGFVRINNGFTIISGATGSMDTWVTVSGGIDLRDTGYLQLLSSLFLDKNVTLSSGGRVIGRENTIHMGGDLTIPDNAVLHFCSDTTIDGGGCILKIGKRAQLFVDHTATLTLKNMVVETTKNDLGAPAIRVSDNCANLALDNVRLCVADDFEFLSGHLFIHNDVFFTGTSSFIYKSPVTSYVTPGSQLHFDKGTEFFFRPCTANNNLVWLVDKSSGISFDGCALQTTHTGLRLTTGRIFFDNKVTVSTVANTALIGFSGSTVGTADFSTEAHFVSWNPSGRFLAAGGVNGASNLVVYSFNGASLTSVTTVNVMTTIKGVSWSPDGKFLAITGDNGASNNLMVYSFNGASLTQVATQNFGGMGQSVAWSPDGKFIVVGGTSTIEEGLTGATIVYNFHGLSLSLAGYDTTSTIINSVAWSPNGKFIAAVGANGGNDVIVYSYNRTSATLTLILTLSFGSGATSASWSPDGNFLAVAGDNGTDDLVVYSFNGVTLTQIDSVDFGANGALSVSWNPLGGYLAVGGANGLTDVIIYRFDGSVLTFIDSKSFGIQADSVAWNSPGLNLAIAGDNGSADVSVYGINYTFDATSQPIFNGLVLGSSEPCVDVDPTVLILSGAWVQVFGRFAYDFSDPCV